MPTKTAVLTVNVTKFRPVGVVLTSATLSLQAGCDKNYFKTDGTNIWITIPKKAPKDLDIEIIFEVNASDYLLVGVAFNKTNFDPNAEGAAEFPEIVITRSYNPITPMVGISRMKIKDAHVASRMGVNYDYYLMIQQVSDGSIGVIDPPISTDPNDNA
jgi:hypothetical protein